MLYKLEQEAASSTEVAPVATAAADANVVEASAVWGAYEAAYKELSKWVDVASADYVTTHSVFEAAAGRPATAIKVGSFLCD